MQEWKTYTLKDLSKGKGEYGIGASAIPFDKDKLIYLRITDINDDGTLNKSGLTSVDAVDASKYLLEKNDIVFARTGNSTGRSYFYDGSDGPLVYAGFLIRFRLDDSKFNPRILKYYSHSKPYYDWVQSFDTGGTRGNINAKTYGDMPITLPPRHVQDRIVDILYSLDAKIENNRRINDNLEQQAQALYKSWFVDFEPFREGEFIESKLGLIPSTWRTSSLLKMINVMSGGTPKTNEDKYWNGEIPFFTPKDNDSSIYCHSTEKYITELGLNKCNSLLYPKDTIFVTARGTVGKICLSGTAMAMNQSCYAIVANDSSQQLFWYYTISNLIRVIKNKANGAVFDAITVKDFDEVIVIPDNPTINSFVQRVSAMFESINNNLLENINLAKQRDSILPKLMSGELKINEIDC